MKVRKWAESEFVRVIRISQKDYNFLNKIRGKKSKAGMLKEIIKQYKGNYE